MAGIYVHVPFCKVKCHYCDFHFSTNHSLIDQMVNAIILELDLRKSYLNEEIETIYFGGGTPSLLGPNRIARILKKVYEVFNVKTSVEITLECNPDDLNEFVLKEYYELGVNRLSIGIQSFDDDVLKFMNRAHSAKEAILSVNQAKTIGIENITIDLIYGLPTTDNAYFLNQLKIFKSLEVPHLSAYCLTIEDGTAFGNWRKKGKLSPLPEEDSLSQFDLLMTFAEKEGFVQYEISNFAKPGWYSKHNSSYWNGTHYLGVGPSAHSFNGVSRQWNLANNHVYVKALRDKNEFYESETLSVQDHFNEYLLTRLRRIEGINMNDLRRIQPEVIPSTEKLLKEFVKTNWMRETKEGYALTKEGKYRADYISGKLFI